MSKDHTREYIISYDIADPKRLGRIHRMIKRLAMPLQYSVFYTRMSERQRDKLTDLLENKINPKEDDIRIYPLPNGYNVQYLGQNPFGEGLQLTRQNGHWKAAIDQELAKAQKRLKQQESDEN